MYQVINSIRLEIKVSAETLCVQSLSSSIAICNIYRYIWSVSTLIDSFLALKFEKLKALLFPGPGGPGMLMTGALSFISEIFCFGQLESCSIDREMVT